MITKSQLQSIIKEKLLWPGWNYSLTDTVDGIQNSINDEVEGLVEIIIEYLYQNHKHTNNWTDIFNVDLADSDKEVTCIPCQNNNFHPDDIVRIYGTLNYNKEYIVHSATTDTFCIYESYKPEVFRLKYSCSVCGYYKVSDQELTSNLYCPICSARYPNQITLLNYDPPRVTKVSLDGYSESESLPLKLGYAVEPTNIVLQPKYLPNIGYKVGYTYNQSLSIAQNRKFIKSAIDVYRIKGTILSIRRMMRLLGFDCKVNEPYKQIFKLNKSTLSGTHKLQSWDYYHHGVFEIETNDVSLSQYKDTITSTVQPVGTRLIGRNNITLPIIPILPPNEVIDYVFKSIYIESVIRLIKSGDIYDIKSSSRRSKSGDREVSGFYISKGIELLAQAYRRVFDSSIFSLADLSTSYIVNTPAGSYSKFRGAYSGSSSRVYWNTTNYNELSPLDLQLPFTLKDYQSRLPARSDHAVRSGKFSQSGTEGTGWNKSRYWIQNYGPIVELLDYTQNLVRDGLQRELYTEILTNQSKPGNILSVNRVLSNIRKVFGFEMITQLIFRGISDWENKIYYSYDDSVRHIPIYNLSDNLVNTGFITDRHLKPLILRDPTRFTHNNYSRSGSRQIYGISHDLGIEVRSQDELPTIKVAFDESHRRLSGVDYYTTMMTSWDTSNYTSRYSKKEIYQSPLESDLTINKYLRSGVRSSHRGSFSGKRIRDIQSDGFNLVISN